MALSIELLGINWLAGKYSLESLSVDISPALQFLGDPRFREIPNDCGYLDLFAVLSPKEVLEIVKRNASQRPAGSALDAHLDRTEQSLKRVTFVVAHVYEWESGIG